jgi:two-component system response regulator GlrR
MKAKSRILLVDDDQDLLRLLTMRLTAAGYDVITAESGERALGQLQIACPHLVITDLRMDGIDGLSLFEAIHSKNPALPTIILTAHGTIPDAVAATKRGVFSFLTKPFDGKDLLAQIEKALNLSGAATTTKSDGEDASWRSEIITRSAIMEDLLAQAKLIAESESSVLIRGGSGTGKELLAKAMHKASPRRDKPFVAINCAAIPESLLESELFGHSKGSFTGALQNYEGLFRSAEGGTLFLDEIGDMPLPLQVKLLRVLQDRQVRQVGSVRATPVDVRIISATHRNLEEALKAGHFREDLYYRLNVVALEIPTLAQRREDIPLLALHFLRALSKRNNKSVRGFSSEALETLVGASWPGNVRQLLNVVEQSLVLATTPIISETLVQAALRQKSVEVLSLREAKNRFEQSYLIQLLRITNGNVSQAARLAKRNRTEFYKLLHRHRLDPAVFKYH